MEDTPRADPASTIKLGTFLERRDWNRFPDAYFDPEVGILTGVRGGRSAEERFTFPVCVEPLTYTGHDEVQRDIANLKAGMEAAGIEQAFLCSLGAPSLSRIGNSHYATEEEFVWACAEAMREEYLAITDAGIIVQIDEPSFADELGPVRDRAVAGGLPGVHDGPRRGAQPRPARHPARAHPLPLLLGQLARPAHRPTSR